MPIHPASPDPSRIRQGDVDVPAGRETREAMCPACGGSGLMDGVPCPECGGDGRIPAVVEDG